MHKPNGPNRPDSEPPLSSTLPSTYKACLDIFKALVDHREVIIDMKDETNISEFVHIRYRTARYSDYLNAIQQSSKTSNNHIDTPHENPSAPLFTVPYHNLQADITAESQHPSKYTRIMAEILQHMVAIQIKYYYDLQHIEKFYHDLQNKLAHLPTLADLIKQEFPELQIHQLFCNALQELKATCAEFEEKKPTKMDPAYISLPYFPEFSNAVLTIVNIDTAFFLLGKSGEYKKINYSDQVASQDVSDWKIFTEILREETSQLKHEQNEAKKRIKTLGEKLQNLVNIYQRISIIRGSIIAQGSNIHNATQEYFAHIGRTLINTIDFFNDSFYKEHQQKWHNLRKIFYSIVKTGGVDITEKVDQIDIKCVDTAIIRVLENLIKKAFFHSDQKNISIDCNRTDENLEITIKSCGEQLDPKDIPSFFQYRYLGNSRQNNRGELSFIICRDLCDENNWEIKAENHPEGVQFIFMIPLKAVRWE